MMIKSEFKFRFHFKWIYFLSKRWSFFLIRWESIICACGKSTWDPLNEPINCLYIVICMSLYTAYGLHGICGSLCFDGFKTWTNRVIIATSNKNISDNIPMNQCILNSCIQMIVARRWNAKSLHVCYAFDKGLDVINSREKIHFFPFRRIR